jgi:hypothetical protein
LIRIVVGGAPPIFFGALVAEVKRLVHWLVEDAGQLLRCVHRVLVNVRSIFVHGALGVNGLLHAIHCGLIPLVGKLLLLAHKVALFYFLINSSLDFHLALRFLVARALIDHKCEQLGRCRGLPHLSDRMVVKHGLQRAIWYLIET